MQDRVSPNARRFPLALIQLFDYGLLQPDLRKPRTREESADLCAPYASLSHCDVRLTRSTSQPIVSTANVPQLAADLLIASLDLKCIGIFDPQYLVPAIGGRDDDDNAVGVTSPLECTL